MPETAPPPPPTLPRVSVVIPHRNTPDLLARCLASVVAQQLDRGHAEIIVVDNGSTVPLDGVRAAFPEVRFLSEMAPGPGLARNTGAAAALAPLLAFIDADCRALPGWLQSAVDAVEADPAHPVGGEVGIDFAAPPHLTGIEAYEAVFGFRQRLYIEKKHFSVTANLAMTRAIFAHVGPFGGIDIAEDLDWGRRAHALGHGTRFVEAMRILHPARADFAAVQQKWQRLIRHDWNAHVAAGRSPLTWRLRALALQLSVPVEGTRILFSNRLSGLANRWRGFDVLARTRRFRAAEMQRVMVAPNESGGDFWNRAG